MNQFQTALTTGQVVVRKWWVNANNPNQIGVQFFQEIESSNQVNNLVALAQGIRPVQTVSAIYSFAKEVALPLLGSTEGDLSQGAKVIFGKEMFKGIDVSIEVTENFTPNPFSSSHEPKINPATGEIVLGYNEETGKNEPVYRHTNLVAGLTPNHVWAPRPVEEPRVDSFNLIGR